MMTTVNLGIKNTEAVATALGRYLANTYFLYLKTQNFHWNVAGELFYSLHGLFEVQYEDLQEATDTLAERIRALGVRAPASFSEFSKLADIKEQATTVSAMEMVSQLLADNETMSRLGKEVIKIAEAEGDDASADLIVGRLEAHEKAAWMLRSTLA
jgi:starvation-inducible DNA-binding protein